MTDAPKHPGFVLLLILLISASVYQFAPTGVREDVPRTTSVHPTLPSPAPEFRSAPLDAAFAPSLHAPSAASFASQSIGVRLYGRAVFEDQRPCPGTEVSVRLDQEEWSALCDVNGNFSFEDLPRSGLAELASHCGDYASIASTVDLSLSNDGTIHRELTLLLQPTVDRPTPLDRASFANDQPLRHHAPALARKSASAATLAAMPLFPMADRSTKTAEVEAVHIRESRNGRFEIKILLALQDGALLPERIDQLVGLFPGRTIKEAYQRSRDPQDGDLANPIDTSGKVVLRRLDVSAKQKIIANLDVPRDRIGAVLSELRHRFRDR